MRLIWDTKRQQWVKPSERAPDPRVHLVSDWGPVMSPLTDEVLGGRSAYLDHLAAHGCHIKERGEGPRPKKSNRAEIRAAVKQTLQDMKVVG